LAVEEKVGRRIAAEKSSNTAAIFTAELNRRTRETSEYSLKTHGIATPKRTASYGNFTTSF